MARKIIKNTDHPNNWLSGPTMDTKLCFENQKWKAEAIQIIKEITRADCN